MSNLSWDDYLPPGVTHAHPMFNSVESEIDAVCERMDFEAPMMTVEHREAVERAERLLAKPTQSIAELQDALRRLVNIGKNAPIVDVRQCPFEGEVLAVYDGTTVAWTCPDCGGEHDRDPDFDDPRIP